MKVIIPLAGKDKRFEEIGAYKPLIDINREPLIYHVITQNKLPKDNLHFIILDEHEDKYKASENLKKWFGKSIHIYIVGEQTLGAPNTILEIKDKINDDEDIIIELADVVCQTNNLFEDIQKIKDSKAIVPVDENYSADNWGYIIKKKGKITELREKSPERLRGGATMGLYYFRKGSEFVKYAEEMIRKEKRIGLTNLYYVGPIVNEYIEDNKKISTSENEIRYVLGSPEQIEEFVKIEK